MSNKKLNYLTAVGFLSKYISKRRRNFIMFYFGWFVDMLLSITMPILFGIMINEIVYYQNMEIFIKISIIFVLMSVFSCMLYFLIYAQHHYLMSMYIFDIKMDIFNHLQKCDAKFLTGLSSGEAVATIQQYAVECMHFVIRNVIHTSNHIITVIVVTSYLFTINWKIGLLIVFAVPISVWISVRFGKKIRKYGETQREYYGNYIGWAYDILSGLREIRMLGAERKTDRDFVRNHKKMFGVNIKTGVSTITAKNAVGLANLVLQLMIFGLIGYEAVRANITVGSFTVILAFFSILTGKIKILSESWLNAQMRISFIQRIYDFMHSPTEDIREDKKELEVTRGAITFHDIHFAYDEGNAVLDGFSLSVSGGEHFALAGRSGNGKTTLAYMMIGFYQPQRGYIEIDGQKLSGCSLKSIRQNIGIIQQDVLLFEGTIKENILLGRKNASDNEIIRACQKAGIWDFINGLTEGLDTVVGKNGVGISEGQKQRIAIARIYLKDPKIIIFDEATSSLDKETEEQIHESWKGVLKGRTSIVIAHRQSSVMLCDRVGIIEDGKLCEAGIPSDMIQNSDDFRTLFAVKGETADD